MNVASDVVVLVLPIRGVWTLRLPRKVKIALMGVFGLGFLYVDPEHKLVPSAGFTAQCHICCFVVLWFGRVSFYSSRKQRLLTDYWATEFASSPSCASQLYSKSSSRI